MCSATIIPKRADAVTLLDIERALPHGSGYRQVDIVYRSNPRSDYTDSVTSAIRDVLRSRGMNPQVKTQMHTYCGEPAVIIEIQGKEE